MFILYIIWREGRSYFFIDDDNSNCVKTIHEKKKFKWRATDYNPRIGEALQRFEKIKRNSACVFARSAKIWCSRDFDTNLTLEENAARATAGLAAVATTDEPVDAYLFEIRDKNKYHSSIENFAHSIRRVLFTLSDADPSGSNICRKKYIDQPGWCFEFCGETFFITTFAPIYGPYSARYTYSENDDSAFILFQPESSFLRHNLPPDTPHTRWSPADPNSTVRDIIRRSFRSKGQAYAIPPSTSYSSAAHIVRPRRNSSTEKDDPSSIIRWWDIS